MLKRIVSKMIRWLLATITVLFSASLLVADGHGNGQCSNSTLNGSYGLHARGSVNGVGDFAAVGRFTLTARET